MTGNIFITCAECGLQQRVNVTFKDYSSKFDDCIHTCIYCETKLKVTDPHEFDAAGNIISINGKKV